VLVKQPRPGWIVIVKRNRKIAHNFTMSAVAHCAVLRNPFSTAVATARIPDGSAVLSSSSRLSYSKHYTSQNGNFYLALFPGFQQHLQVYYASGTVASPVADFDAPDLNISSRWFESVATNTLQPNTNAPAKFRISAQGMRVNLIESSENNDGWFEAIRLPQAFQPNDFKLRGAAAAANRQQFILNAENGGVLGGNLGTDVTDVNVVDWAMNPSYITGKLRDINRHTFMLHRENDMDFVDIPNNVAYASSSEALFSTAFPKCWWVDNNMDVVLIRMFSSGACNIHIHTVQHVEEQFEPNNEFARYMTKPPSNPALTNAVLNLCRREIKPSIVRAPTGAVSVRFSKTPRRTYRRRMSIRRKTPVRRAAIKRRYPMRKRVYRRK